MRDPVQRNVPPRPGGDGGDAASPGKGAEPAGATATMSIGEVLGILKPEFPDITVSKIRFLEGAGLVQPDRSASGYRKFSEDDVARLRFVLRAQRDQYLPLRVIRQRLADLEQTAGPGGRGPLVEGSDANAPGDRGGSTPSGAGPAAAASGSGDGSARTEVGTGSPGARSGAAAAGAGGGPAGTEGGAGSATGGGTASAGAGAPVAGSTGTGAAGTAGPGAAGGQPARATGGGFAAAPPSDAQFTRDELCRAAGANVDQLLELESFGLVSARGSGERGAWYGGDDLIRLARELADYGLEARHLRMYKLFAEREAALFEQVVAPLVRQRNPEARARARDTIDALAQLGGRMRDLALRSAVHGLADTRDPHR
jgi:DNA-binding transcriptional MerR regulator